MSIVGTKPAAGRRTTSRAIRRTDLPLREEGINPDWPTDRQDAIGLLEMFAEQIDRISREPNEARRLVMAHYAAAPLAAFRRGLVKTPR